MWLLVKLAASGTVTLFALLHCRKRYQRLPLEEFREAVEHVGLFIDLPPLCDSSSSGDERATLGTVYEAVEESSSSDGELCGSCNGVHRLPQSYYCPEAPDHRKPYYFYVDDILFTHHWSDEDKPRSLRGKQAAGKRRQRKGGAKGAVRRKPVALGTAGERREPERLPG